MRRQFIATLIAMAFSLTLIGCSEQRTSDRDSQQPAPSSASANDAQKPDSTQEAQDNGRKLGEKARDAEIRTRADREKIKEGARDAGKKLRKGTEELAVKASAAAEGIREGWKQGGSNSSTGAVDINHASQSDLVAAGLSRAEAQSVIAGRPYKTKQDLTSRNVLSAATYRGLEDRITVK